MSQADITDASLARLASMPLQELLLSGCVKVTNAGLAYLSAISMEKLNIVTSVLLVLLILR